MIGTLLTLVTLVGADAAPRQFVLVPKKSRLRFSFDHDLHDISAESKSFEAVVVALPDGKIQLMVRAAVTSFESGDANRDIHTQEVVEAGRYPHVVFKAVTRLPPKPPPPGPWTLELQGQLDFHGRKKRENVTLRAWLDDGGALRVTGSFVVSLEKYEIERPSLLFVELDDACKIDIDIELVEKKK